MKKLFLVFSLLAINCASYHQLMLSPDGTIQDCASYGQGLIGMAAASNIKDGCVTNLKRAGYIELEKAGVIGIQLRNDESMTILKVIERSPADIAGIKPDDKIESIDGRRVTNSRDALSLLIGVLGQPVNLTTSRGQDTLSYKLIRASYIAIYGKPE